MKILVTGAKGFVGKNLVATLHTMKEFEIYSYDMDSKKEDLKQFTKDCNFVVHLAGVNRPQNPKEFYEGNAGFTETLCKYLKENDNKSPILISSSIQAAQDNDYGKSKLEGEKSLLGYGEENDVKIYIYRFSNLFGKWCRPNYNSVVATWCHNIANGLEVMISDKNAEMRLCYIDDVIAEIINAIQNNATIIDGECKVQPEYRITLGDLKARLTSFKESRKDLSVPYMGDALTKKLYSTYLSYLSKDAFSYPLKQNIDHRGSFTEFLKTDAYGQVSVNISKPGITKGNHWHHSKNEKFLVVFGSGIIRFRNIFNDEIIEYKVNGDHLEVVDIPTGYTHNIENIGGCDMVTIMWANEKFDAEHPDTFYEEV